MTSYASIFYKQAESVSYKIEQSSYQQASLGDRAHSQQQQQQK